MFKHQDQKSEKGHRTKVHAWFGKRNLKKTWKLQSARYQCQAVLSPHLYSLHIRALSHLYWLHIPTLSTSLLSTSLYSFTSRLSRISTLSRPDSLASLLSPHPCSLHFSALSKSLFSHIPTFSTSWKFVKRSLGFQTSFGAFLKEFTEHQHLLEGWLIESRPKRPSPQDDVIVWLQGYIRRPGPGLGWPIHHLRVSMSNFGWFEGTSILENLHVTTRKLNGMMVCTE